MPLTRAAAFASATADRAMESRDGGVDGGEAGEADD